MVKANTTTKTPRKPITMQVFGDAGPSRLERMRAKLAKPAEPATTPDKPAVDEVAAVGAVGGRKVVAIDKVLENPGNERKTFRGMEGITATVEAFGILEPPTVEPKGDGTYLLVTGHRRARAARSLGHETIEVLVRDADDERLRRRKSIVSNVQHQDVDAIELAEGLQALLDEDEAIGTQADLAAAIGKTRSWVSETLGILRLKPALQVKVRAHDRPLPYDAISKIAREDVAHQDELIDALLTGEGVTDIRARIAARAESEGDTADAAKAKKRPKAGTRAGGGTITFDLDGGVSLVLRHPGRAPSLADQAKLLRSALGQLEAQAA